MKDADGRTNHEPLHFDRYVDERIFRYNTRATREDPLTDAMDSRWQCRRSRGRKLLAQN
jgi:hypothetical protein